jgi:hypothetical protein
MPSSASSASMRRCRSVRACAGSGAGSGGGEAVGPDGVGDAAGS